MITMRRMAVKLIGRIRPMFFCLSIMMCLVDHKVFR